MNTINAPETSPRRSTPTPARSAGTRRPRRLLALLVVPGMALTGCAGIDADPSARAEAAGGDTQWQRDRPWTAQELGGQFDDLRSRLRGEIAISWAPVGSRGQVQSLGGIRDLDAWSTAKVPLGVARLRLAGGKLDDKTQEVLRRAIADSDNEASRVLWRGLGTEKQAVAIMDKVARDTGDEVTTFSTKAFGRSAWTMANQAQFAAGLPCIDQGPPVLDIMGNINPDHRWGLGATSLSVQFKGGWGIGPRGLLVRQLGVAALPDGSQIGIALATMPNTKDQKVGESNLDAMAQWLLERLGPHDGGRCPS